MLLLATGCVWHVTQSGIKRIYSVPVGAPAAPIVQHKHNARNYAHKCCLTARAIILHQEATVGRVVGIAVGLPRSRTRCCSNPQAAHGKNKTTEMTGTIMIIVTIKVYMVHTKWPCTVACAGVWACTQEFNHQQKYTHTYAGVYHIRPFDSCIVHNTHTHTHTKDKLQSPVPQQHN